MRLPIMTGALLLAACTAGTADGNQAAEAETPIADAAVSNQAIAPLDSDPDTPVSSDDPTSQAPSPSPLPGPKAVAPNRDCPVVGSSDWMAHVDAMPGPNDNPRLIVSGKVTVPTGGYRVALRMGQVAESYPVQVTVHLDAQPPAGPATQALVTHDVRGSWPSEERVGSVTIRCGKRVLARLDGIETAH